MRIYRHLESAPGWHPGLGQTPAQPTTLQTAAGIAAAGAGTTAGILGAMGAFTATGVALGPLTLGISAAVTGLIAISQLIMKAFAGCGQTCVVASDYANQVEPLLQQNLTQYQNAPVHYASLQKGALNNFDTLWAALVQACSNPQLQAAGQRCVTDREQGACHFHDASGACWNWFIGYRDPIANDSSVVPDPSPVTTTPSGSSNGSTSSGSTVTGGSSGLPMPLLLGGGLLAVLLLTEVL